MDGCKTTGTRVQIYTVVLLSCLVLSCPALSCVVSLLLPLPATGFVSFFVSGSPSVGFVSVVVSVCHAVGLFASHHNIHHTKQRSLWLWKEQLHHEHKRQWFDRDPCLLACVRVSLLKSRQTDFVLGFFFPVRVAESRNEKIEGSPPKIAPDKPTNKQTNKLANGKSNGRRASHCGQEQSLVAVVLNCCTVLHECSNSDCALCSPYARTNTDCSNAIQQQILSCLIYPVSTRLYSIQRLFLPFPSLPFPSLPLSIHLLQHVVSLLRNNNCIPITTDIISPNKGSHQSRLKVVWLMRRTGLVTVNDDTPDHHNLSNLVPKR